MDQMLIFVCLFGILVTNRTKIGLSAILNEETTMPYHFDVININDLENTELKNHIERIGKCIFKNDKIPNSQI